MRKNYNCFAWKIEVTKLHEISGLDLFALELLIESLKFPTIKMFNKEE